MSDQPPVSSAGSRASASCIEMQGISGVLASQVRGRTGRTGRTASGLVAV